jgi:hypothetical protein
MSGRLQYWKYYKLADSILSHTEPRFALALILATLFARSEND